MRLMTCDACASSSSPRDHLLCPPTLGQGSDATASRGGRGPRERRQPPRSSACSCSDVKSIGTCYLCRKGKGAQVDGGREDGCGSKRRLPPICGTQLKDNKEDLPHVSRWLKMNTRHSSGRGSMHRLARRLAKRRQCGRLQGHCRLLAAAWGKLLACSGQQDQRLATGEAVGCQKR